MSYAEFQDLRQRTRTLTGVAASRLDSVTLHGADEPRRIMAFSVSGNYHDVLGLTPASRRRMARRGRQRDSGATARPAADCGGCARRGARVAATVS